MIWKYNVNDRVIDRKEDGSLKRDITVLEQKIIKNKKWYKYRCNICSWDDGWVSENNFVQHKSGCSCCRGATIVKGINTVGDLRPDLIKYFKNKEDAYHYTIGTPRKAVLICPDCLSEVEISINHLTSRGFHCKNCGNKTSYPERFVQQVLKQLNIEYDFQLSRKRFEWCGKYKYDFYLPKYNYIIEVHGGQHYPRTRNFFYTTYEKIHNNDIVKYELAKTNGIEKYIIINASKSENEYLKHSIMHELGNYFDLNIVNWSKCGIDASKSILIEICKYWKQTKSTSSQIGKHFNLSRTTVKNYLNKGAELGICKYNGEEEKTRVKKMPKGHTVRDQKIKEICDFYNDNPDLTLNDIAQNFSLTVRTIRDYLELGNEQNLCVYYPSTCHDKKNIGVFKDGRLILTHFGASSLARNSLQLLGVKLHQGHICSVCRGERQNHGGFNFKFLE